ASEHRRERRQPRWYRAAGPCRERPRAAVRPPSLFRLGGCPMVYPVSGDPLVPSPKLPALENAIQEFWRTDDTFRASIAQREGAEEFVFYDGPPFANGLPHYGHL